ncbi:MAG TPA: guanylate kinase [Candidatus Bipolaricaulis anaerobius]|nr:guanylate kinase [Candidatus Bipolaricaulis anaerobius]MDD5764232.1 guanylate kinase [Candidatus Bipolaricaulis anaerobius]HNR23863.1 guanylate kinase [Candidatus Bipolaricaulis anaerobius]HNS24054.1 guanylate kinase [Candidatus Bipolaricaulis anaerobius]HOD73851.1 guanylate kinase [Candidatus Bipolaricaulis anaerobius]
MRDFLPTGWDVQGGHGIALVIAGPSGAGKSSVIAALLRRDPSLVFSVSATTRPRRPDEADGRDYTFVSDAAFDRMIRAGELLEWTTYQGHRYGTPRAAVVGPLAAGRDVVINVEVKGALALRRSGLPHPVVLVFMVPPSREELVRRIRSRGTESADALAARLAIAEEEVRHIPEFDYLVVNDRLEEAVERVEAILVAERSRIRRCSP